MAYGKSGTTEHELQQTIAAGFTNYAANPIVGGGDVHGQADLTFQVDPGVAIITLGSGIALEIGFDGGKTGAITPPTSGSSTVTIYVDQNRQISVAAGSSAPAGTAILDIRNVPANITATTATTSTYSKNYALPYGASLGVLAHQTENVKDSTALPTGKTSRYTLPFTIRTDRALRVILRANVRSFNLPSDGSNPYGSMIWQLDLDGVQIGSVEKRFDRFNDQTQVEWILAGTDAVKAGDHVAQIWGTQQWVGNTGGAAWFAGGNWTPGGLTILDLGPAQ